MNTLVGICSNRMNMINGDVFFHVTSFKFLYIFANCNLHLFFMVIRDIAAMAISFLSQSLHPMPSQKSQLALLKPVHTPNVFLRKSTVRNALPVTQTYAENVRHEFSDTT
ncbi:hypothetical protein VNO77_27996 [Canavalia gladiata]|uniref:Uncharacterized protein n=1 Tax=Canavalia gladiata TaxID=3824 RepID=A0AAN9Q709_CANGL